MHKKKSIVASLILAASVAIIGCSEKLYATEGENIYRTGKNLLGEALLDKRESQITIFKSCQGCHGKSGDGMRHCNIQWSYLTNPGKMEVPYTESLFFRFMDKDLKSDGTRAETGVHWKMSKEEETALLDFLKTL